MNAPHPSFLFQADDQIELGRRRAAKAARLCIPSGSSVPAATAAASTVSYATLGYPIFLGTKQDDTEQLALGGSGADGGREKVLDALLEGGRGMWTAESGGLVRRVDLSTGNTTDVVLAHKAPVSCLALFPLPITGRALLFSSGWDKTIHIHLIITLSYSATVSDKPNRLRPLLSILAASTDFIKALEVLPEHQALLSGGSDKIIRIWDLSPLIRWCETQETGDGKSSKKEQPSPPIPKSIGSFGEHTRAITSITSLAPPTITSLSPISTGNLPNTTIIYSADSMGRIFQMTLNLGDKRTANEKVGSDSNSSSCLPPRAQLIIERELRGPETSVTDLKAGWLVRRGEEVELDDEEEEGLTNGAGSGEPAASLVQAQIWVASNDKSVQLFTPFELDSRISSRGVIGRPATKSCAISPHSRISKVGAALGFQPPLSPTLAIKHADYVKSVLPLAVFTGQGLPRGIVISGSADEDLRVWKVRGLHSDDDETDELEDEDEADQNGSKENSLTSSTCRLLRRQEGHWHEVEKLLLWKGSLVTGQLLDRSDPTAQQDGPSDQEQQERWYVISTGLDASIRRWPLSRLLQPQSEQERTAMETMDCIPLAIESTLRSGTSAGDTTAAALDGKSARANIDEDDKNKGVDCARSHGTSGMTAEEERELEELMGSDGEL